MPLPTPSTDHVLRALGRLIQQYQQPDIEKWLTSYVEEIQELEDAIWTVITGVYLDNAEGVNLDMIGELVREQRRGREDATYRLGIRTRIRINRSHGRALDVLEVARQILGGAYPQLLIEEQQPATIIANFTQGVDFGTYSTLVTAMLETKAAGVKMWIMIGTDPNPDCPFDDGQAFIFNHDDAAGLRIKGGQPPAAYFHADDLSDANPNPVIMPRRYGAGQITANGAPTLTNEWHGRKTLRLNGVGHSLSLPDLSAFHTDLENPWLIAIALIKDSNAAAETIVSVSRDEDKNFLDFLFASATLVLSGKDDAAASTFLPITKDPPGIGTPVILGMAIGGGEVITAELSSLGMHVLGRQAWVSGSLVGTDKFTIGALLTGGAIPSQHLNGAIRAAVVTQGFALNYVSELTDLMYQLQANNCDVSAAPLLVQPSAGIVPNDPLKGFGSPWTEGIGICAVEPSVTDILPSAELGFTGQNVTSDLISAHLRFRLGCLDFTVDGRNPGRALLAFLTFQDDIKITKQTTTPLPNGDTVTLAGYTPGDNLTTGQLRIDLIVGVLQISAAPVEPVVTFGSTEFRQLACEADTSNMRLRFYFARVAVGDAKTLQAVCTGALTVHMYTWEGEYETRFQFRIPFGCISASDDAPGTTPNFDIEAAVNTGRLTHIQSASDVPPSAAFDPSIYAAIWLSSSNVSEDLSNRVATAFNQGTEGSQWDATVEAPGEEPLLVLDATPSGRPSLLFEGNEHLLTDAVEDLTSAFLNPTTIISVVRRTGVATVDAYSQKTGNTTRALHASVSAAYFMYGADVTELIDTNAPIVGLWQVHVAIHKGSKSRASQNGAAYTNPKILNNPITDLSIVNEDVAEIPKLVNWRVGGTAIPAGSTVEVAEFVVVRGELGPQQVCDMISFFKTRHGTE